MIVIHSRLTLGRRSIDPRDVANGTWTLGLGGQRDSNEPPKPPGVGGRIVATLAFSFFLGMGLLFVVFLGREILRGAETYGWAERRCEIVRSEVVRDGSDEQPYRPSVAFRTADAGPPIEGRAIRRGALSYSTHNDAAERIAPYPVGSTATCWVSADGEAVLERGPLWIGLWLLLPLVFVAIGAGGIYASWRRPRTDRFGAPVPEALGERKADRSAAFVTAFGALFAIAGAAMSWFLAIVPLMRIADARSWDRLECTVEQSSVLTHEGDDSTTYSVDILYRWDRGRGVERSSRYDFFGGSSSGYGEKAAIVAAHPPGTKVPCWVDPELSNEAVLVPGLTATAWIALLPFGFLAAGLGVIAFGRQSARRRARVRRLASEGALPFPPGDAILEVLPHRGWQTGPAQLAAQSSRWGRVLGVTFAALFWNGIVSVFVNEAWKAWERGRPEWFLMLFLLPFVLIGIALCAGIVHSLLALRNPRPLLRVGAGSPRLGQRVELHWSFAGAVTRLEHVRIALRGVEKATYQVGTDSRTATEIFHDEALVDLPAPMCRMGGFASIAVPESSMHSFESGHNEIVWTLELEGRVRWWPNVKETYPLVVLPRAAAERKRKER